MSLLSKVLATPRPTLTQPLHLDIFYNPLSTQFASTVWPGYWPLTTIMRFLASSGASGL